MTQHTGADVATTRTLSDRALRRITVLMAVACGSAVANLYYAQPLLALIAGSFHVGEGLATVVVTVTQLGYALGLLLLLPLGDLVNNRPLTSRMMLGTAVALAVAAFSPVFPLFLVMAVLVGVTSVVAQILVPLAAHLAPEEQRGRVVGQVMSGLLLGILLARTVASLVAAEWGWRSIYVVSAVLMVLVAVCLHTGAARPCARPHRGLRPVAALGRPVGAHRAGAGAARCRPGDAVRRVHRVLDRHHVRADRRAPHEPGRHRRLRAGRRRWR